MSAAVESTQRIWTEAELQALPEDGYIHEIVNGELVMSPKNNFQHGDICIRLSFALESFNRAHKLGVVLDSSTGFWMKNRNCRAPDISFIPKERLKRLGFRRHTRQFFPGAPDLAVEILSPNNTRAEMDERLADFFASGTQLAWMLGSSILKNNSLKSAIRPCNGRFSVSALFWTANNSCLGSNIPSPTCFRNGIGIELPSNPAPDTPRRRLDRLADLLLQVNPI